MKIEKVFSSYNSKQTPILLAKGVVGGGFVSVSVFDYRYPDAGFSIGTSEVLLDINKFGQVKYNLTNMFYLKEGEELYVPALRTSDSTSPLHTVIYYNNEQFTTQSQASPINLSGTIQLNQQ